MGKDRSGRGPKWARTEVGATFGIRTEVGMDRSGLVPKWVYPFWGSKIKGHRVNSIALHNNTTFRTTVAFFHIR